MYRRGEGPSYRWRGTFQNMFLDEFIIKGHEIIICDPCVAHQVPVGHLMAVVSRGTETCMDRSLTCASSCGEPGGLSGRRRAHTGDTGKVDDLCASGSGG